MRVGIPKETWPGETRVAVIPAGDRRSREGRPRRGGRVRSRNGRRFPRRGIPIQGAALVARPELFKTSDIVLQVRATPADSSVLRTGQTVIGFADPLGSPAGHSGRSAPTGVNLFSMELMPRITRAQSMDALSSMATIAGYKGVLLAATTLPRMFPDAHDGCRHDLTGARLHHGRRRCRTAGHLHGAPARRQGRSVRRAAGGQGAGAKSRRASSSNFRSTRATRKTRAGTPKRRTRLSTSGSAR